MQTVSHPFYLFFLAGKDDFESKILSPVGDFPLGLSLDLSPSDSSGGTYMWDEEGLEGLGGSGHPCASFDSDLNSIVSQCIINTHIMHHNYTWYYSSESLDKEVRF